MKSQQNNLAGFVRYPGPVVPPLAETSISTYTSVHCINPAIHGIPRHEIVKSISENTQASSHKPSLIPSVVTRGSFLWVHCYHFFCTACCMLGFFTVILCCPSVRGEVSDIWIEARPPRADASGRHWVAKVAGRHRPATFDWRRQVATNAIQTRRRWGTAVVVSLAMHVYVLAQWQEISVYSVGGFGGSRLRAKFFWVTLLYCLRLCRFISFGSVSTFHSVRTDH